MKKRKEEIKGVIYLSLIALAVLASLLYGNLLDANIGDFLAYKVFGDSLHISLIILIPIVITLLYIYIIILGKKYRLVKMNVNHFSFIVILLIMMIYMGTLVLTKDYSSYLGEEIYDSGVVIGESPTINERIWSLFSFYLSLLTIYAFFELVKPVKHFKAFFYLILSLLIAFCLSSIIYSLIFEQDKIALFNSFSVIYNKEAYLNSFFGHTNVFGHLLFFGVLSFVALAFLTRKYFLIIPSFLFTPFIVFSACRAAMMSTLVLYLSVFLYFYIRSFFIKKWLFYLLSLVLFSLLVVIFVDSTIYSFIRLDIGENETISLYEAIGDVFDRLITKRFNLIENIMPIYQSNDYIFGFGYGIAFLLARTYNEQAYYMHNSLFEIYFQGGIVYLVFLVSIYIYVLYRTIRYAKRSKKTNILGYLIISTIGIGFYGLYESMPILFNDFLGGATGLFLILLPLVFVTYSENGYSLIDLSIETQKGNTKTFYVSDLYNKKKLEKHFEKNMNISVLQEVILEAISGLDLEMNQRVNVTIVKENQDGVLRKVKCEYNNEDLLTIFIYI